MIGEEIKRIRGKCSRDVFSTHLGVHKNTLALYENDANDRLPEIDFLAILAEKEHQDFDHLLRLRLADSKCEEARKLSGIKEEAAGEYTISGIEPKLNTSVAHYNDVDVSLRKIFKSEKLSQARFCWKL